MSFFKMYNKFFSQIAILRHILTQPMADPRHDTPYSCEPKVMAVMSTLPRCGSELMSATLASSGAMGLFTEYLDSGMRYNPRFIRYIFNQKHYYEKLIQVRTSQRGIFATKMFWRHLTVKGGQNFLDYFSKTYSSDIRFLYLYREDTLAQAISYVKALQTQAWTSKREAVVSPHYDFDQITRAKHKFDTEGSGWRNYFEKHNISTVVIKFEDFVNDIEGESRKALLHLGAENGENLTIKIPGLKKQSDTINMEWRERYIRDSRGE